MRKKAFKIPLANLGLALCSLLLTAVAAEAAYRVFLGFQLRSSIEPGQKYLRSEYHSVLGWRNVPGQDSHRIYTDLRGFRVASRGEIDRTLTGRVIAALGDSFTYGDGVKGSKAWPNLLDVRLSGREYHVLNMGICAFGIDQMYLYYRETEAELSPEVVLVGVVSWDIQRTGKPHWKPGGRQKPMFVFREGRLELTNVPVPFNPQAGKSALRWQDIVFDFGQVYLLSRLDPRRREPDYVDIPENLLRSEDIEPNKYAAAAFLSQKIIEKWREEVETRGGIFAVVFIPTKKEVDYYHSYLSKLRDNLRRKGVNVIDCREAFLAARDRGIGLWRGSHPSSAGHRVIAEEVYYFLAAKGITEG